MGGKPSKGTSADRRLKGNRPKPNPVRRDPDTDNDFDRFVDRRGQR